LTFLPEEQLLAWLKAQGLEAKIDGSKIIVPAANLQLRLESSYANLKPEDEKQALRWVEAVELITPRSMR
jgi:hypothetical protein